MKKITKLLVVTLVSMIGLSSVVLGGTITKAFELGEGTANAVSNRRTFAVPCGLAVSATVKYSRKGHAAAENDVPLTITLIKPAEDGGEGEIAQTKQVTAKTTPQNVGLSGDSSSFGCSAPWSVRVRPTSGTSDLAIYGEISVTFNDTRKTLSVESAGSINLNSGNSVEKNIYFGDFGNNPQGVIEITGEWYHNLGISEIPMSFELIDPTGNVVKTANGYAQNELRGLTKLKLTYQMSQRIVGVWKLKITNRSNGNDAVRVKPIAAFKPSCP